MPPLNALKAFEAAARHESFARAAEELGVTAAAVAHQVKTLEGWLGAALFRRQARGLALTAAARAAMGELSAAFDALGGAVQGLRAAAPGGRLAIAALPAVAQLWLAPRLAGLRTAFPGLSVSVHALETLPELRREMFDLALFFVEAAPAGCRCVMLGEDVIFPVCTPELAAAVARDGLGRAPLLRDTSWAGDWACWLAAAGLRGVAREDGPAFSLYSMAVQAALDGAGVLMGHRALLRGPLDAGALVAPFPAVARTGRQLAILAPERAGAQARALSDWLAGQA